MASTFADDLAAIQADRPESIATPDVIADQPGGDEPPMLAWVDPEPEPDSASVEARPAVVAEPPICPIAKRVDRLSVAVRLTRQAVIAWASLIEGSSEILTDSR
jgi:hypothetical protein